MAQERDIASGELLDTSIPFQLFAGQAPIITDSAPALAAVLKYQLLALTATGVTPYVEATHTHDQAVIAAQAAGIGKQVPYWNAGKFNHAAVIWPVGLDTLAKRKAFLNGTMLHAGHLN